MFNMYIFVLLLKDKIQIYFPTLLILSYSNDHIFFGTLKLQIGKFGEEKQADKYKANNFTSKLFQKIPSPLLNHPNLL
jgi:hypothetical protein